MMDDRATVAVLSPDHLVVVEGFTAVLGRHPERVQVIDMPASFDDVEPDIVLYDVAALEYGDGSDLVDLVKKTTCLVLAVARDLRPDLSARRWRAGQTGSSR